MPAQDQQKPADADIDFAAAGQPEGGDLTAELADMRERWMRSEAEIANVRARGRRDVEDARNFGIQKFASDMVEAAENLKRGLDSLPPTAPDDPASFAGIRSGLVEIERGLLDVLQRNGVKRDDPTGDVFSPTLHQAIGQSAVSNQPPGTVAQALSPVWTLNGRLLRPAVVVVAIAPTEPQSADTKA